MAGCAALACVEACGEPCPVAALTDRIDALEKAVANPGLWGWVRYLVDHAGGILLLAGGFLAICIVASWWLGGGRKALRTLSLKSASLSAGGASISFEAAAQQMNAMIEAVQDHVVHQAASTDALVAGLRTLQGGMKGAGTSDLSAQLETVLQTFSLSAPGPGKPPSDSAAPFRQRWFSDQPPEQKLDAISILWVLPDAEARGFERLVVKTMGNRIDTLVGTAAARGRLESGASYDLVVIEDSAPGSEGQTAGRDLADCIVRGLPTAPGVGTPRRVQAGPALRLALMVASPDLGRLRDRIGTAGNSGVGKHVLVTDEFFALRRAIRWLQKEKTPPATP